jgi:predicted TIM-barrel fold metal-dependent hydrolase
MTGKQWRDQVIEDALEPELPIIDAHHHIWAASPAPAFEAYDAEALYADKADAGHNIIATVYVDSHANYRSDGPEPFRVVGETEFAESVAEQANRRGGRVAGACAAIVSHADLLLGAAVGEVLDAHILASSRFRGIRHMTAIDPDLPPIYGATEPGIMMRPAFREGFAELGKRGLTFDAWLFQPQLGEVVDLARAFPGSAIVLDHLAGPLGIGRYASRRDEAFGEWKRGMAELAKSPNVVVKLGALNMVFTGLAPDIGAARPHGSEEMARLQRDHILTAIDLFGPDRCMFESNFPVDMLLTSYSLVWNSFKRVTRELGEAERAALFAGTARRVYRIDAA